MSHITTIKGWVEVDGYGENSKGLQEALEALKDSDKYATVPNMFVEIPDSGTKNPHYIVFAATINYALIDEFNEFFEEELLTRLSGFQAFVFISTEQTKSFCKRYKGKRKEGDWELAETLEFFTDDIGACSLEVNPKVSDLFRYPDTNPSIDSIAKMFLRLF